VSSTDQLWLRRFGLVAWLEGISFVLLLGVAMPLKYLAGMPLAVRIVGLTHGILFIAYAWMVLGAMSNRDWSGRRVLTALLAGVLPFGALVFHARLRKSAL
jgi:integral membrane protein